MLWASFFVLIFAIVASSIALLMVLAVVEICDRFDLESLGGTFEAARKAFDNSGVVSVLDSGEKRAFWFLPTVGLAGGVSSTFHDALSRAEVCGPKAQRSH